MLFQSRFDTTHSHSRMAYIEEQMQKRHQSKYNQELSDHRHVDPREELFRITSIKKKLDKPVEDEGSVSNSMKMLTAIPEVDLGME